MSDTVRIETYTEVIIERDPDFWIIECRHCRGTGQKYPAYGGKNSKRKHECRTCGGMGVLALRSPRISCNHCEGTGQKYPKYGGKNSKRKHECPTCGGTGSNHVDDI